MEARPLGVLDQLDLGAKRIHEEGQLEEPRHVADRGEDLRPGAFQLRHRRVDVGDRDPSPADSGANEDAEEHSAAVTCRHGGNYLWAELMRRSLGLDVLACPRCGGRLTLIALIDDPA